MLGGQVACDELGGLYVDVGAVPPQFAYSGQSQAIIENKHAIKSGQLYVLLLITHHEHTNVSPFLIIKLISTTCANTLLVLVPVESLWTLLFERLATSTFVIHGTVGRIRFKNPSVVARIFRNGNPSTSLGF